ncbi:hypothetical protein FJZ19_03410 [Candidatus Pacearchaeota archaeon]|nr:hypothetical protein [Candidatus Pacearchaeota archaeon]
MKFCIIASEKDEAGKNIFKQIQNYKLESFIIKEKDTIFCENLDKQEQFRNFDFFIFITKHQSQEARKTLSVHAPGNWRKADFGGKEGKICPTSALFLKHIFKILNKNAENSGYTCTLECTHHGPYIEKPCCFIEIGTRIENWKDEKAGKIIAETVNEAISSFKQEKFIPAIGIGGPHYCPNFNKIQLNSEYALGHIIPEYTLPLTEEMIKEAVSKTQEKVEIVLLDWKGIGKSEERKKIMKLLDNLGMKYERTGNVEK